MTKEEFFGDAKYLALGAVAVNLQRTIRMWSIDPDANFRDVHLADARLLSLGGPQYMIFNMDAVHTIRINSRSGSTGDITNLAADKIILLYLTDNTTEAGSWSWILFDEV